MNVWKNMKNHINSKIAYGALMYFVYLLSTASYYIKHFCVQFEGMLHALANFLDV